MKYPFIIFLLVLTTYACHPDNRIYIEHQELSPDIEWIKSDSKTFKIENLPTDKTYQLKVALRFVTGYVYDVAKIKITEISPSGIQTKQEYDLQIRDVNGEYIGEPGFDIWDSEHLLEPKKKYKEFGTYTYIIEHNMPEETLDYVMEVGLILDGIK